MTTVAELKKLIREYKASGEICPKVSKMKKKELEEFAVTRELLSKEQIKAYFDKKHSPETRMKTLKKKQKAEAEGRPVGISSYAMFVKEHKKPGMSMADVASMWRSKKAEVSTEVMKPKVKKPTKEVIEKVAVEVAEKVVKPKVKKPTKEKIEEVKKEVVKKVIKPIVKRPSKKLIEKIAEEVPMTVGIVERNKERMEEALNKLRDVERETRVRNQMRKKEYEQKVNPKFLYDKDVDMIDFHRKMKAKGTTLEYDEIDLLYRLKYASNIDQMMKYALETGKKGEFADFAKYYKEHAKPNQNYEAVFKKYVAQKKKD